MRNTKAFDVAKEDLEPIHNMTLQQLESMAARQQDQIRAQAQLLIAKENRLNLLRKQHGEDATGTMRNGQRPQYAMNGGEPGRIMALRQKIEQQEMKLRRLRMLRGQVDQTKASNAALTSDLESIRLLFNEKEKELSLAVGRVEELTNQLEDMRLTRRQRQQNSENKRDDPRSAAHAMQLDALRRELMYRQQVTSSQASRVAHQRSLLSQKQEEMNRVDRRIAELQQRLHRRRLFNNQLVHQLSQVKSNRAPAKIAAVEPFRDDLTATAAEERRAVNAELASTMNKSDPKYQTLPYNTKFSPIGGTLHASHSANQLMVAHSSSAAAKVTKGQATEVKIAPVPPPKPTSSSNSSSTQPTSVSNVILSTSRTYTSVYSPDDTNHHDVDDHHYPSQQRPYLPPKPNSIPPRLSPGKVPDSVEEAVSILKAKSEDLIKFEDKSTVEVTTMSGPASLGVSELSVQPASQDSENKVSFDVAPPTGVKISINRRIEMPPEAMFPENASPPSDLVPGGPQDPNNNRESSVDGDGMSNGAAATDAPDDAGVGNSADPFPEEFFIDEEGNLQVREDTKTRSVLKTREKKASSSAKLQRRVSFDPLALLLDAALEGEVELVKKCALQAPAAALASNDEGITALHNAVCAGHLEIVQFLVEFGCDVNAQDSDGWTPLHCAASCNNLPMVQYLVEKGACVFATTISDQETAAQKCEEDEDGYDSCSEYLYNVQEKLGIWNSGAVYSLYRYEGAQSDELPFDDGDKLVVIRKGDDVEREWWWARKVDGREGYVPRNLLGLYPRVKPSAALMKVAGDNNEDEEERASSSGRQRQQEQRSN